MNNMSRRRRVEIPEVERKACSIYCFAVSSATFLIPVCWALPYNRFLSHPILFQPHYSCPNVLQNFINITCHLFLLELFRQQRDSLRSCFFTEHSSPNYPDSDLSSPPPSRLIISTISLSFFSRLEPDIQIVDDPCTRDLRHEKARWSQIPFTWKRLLANLGKVKQTV